MHTQAIEVKQLVSRCFPGYRGKRFEVHPAKRFPLELSSYWDGGSRDYWALVNLSTNKVFHVPENGTPFSRKAFVIGSLPRGIALVRYHRGNYEYAEVTLHPDNINRQMFPQPTELTWEEKVVLCSTRSYKSSYGGISNYRFHCAKTEVGITAELWESAKQNLISRGLLNKQGAITNEGHNAIGNVNMYSLQKTC